MKHIEVDNERAQECFRKLTDLWEKEKPPL